MGARPRPCGPSAVTDPTRPAARRRKRCAGGTRAAQGQHTQSASQVSIPRSHFRSSPATRSAPHLVHGRFRRADLLVHAPVLLLVCRAAVVGPPATGAHFRGRLVAAEQHTWDLISKASRRPHPTLAPRNERSVGCDCTSADDHGPVASRDGARHKGSWTAQPSAWHSDEQYRTARHRLHFLSSRCRLCSLFGHSALWQWNRHARRLPAAGPWSASSAALAPCGCG